jgi:hypothetical protein
VIEFIQADTTIQESQNSVISITTGDSLKLSKQATRKKQDRVLSLNRYYNLHELLSLQCHSDLLSSDIDIANRPAPIQLYNGLRISIRHHECKVKVKTSCIVHICRLKWFLSMLPKHCLQNLQSHCSPHDLEVLARHCCSAFDARCRYR